MGLTGVVAGRSRTVKTALVLPTDANHLGTMFGGRVMSFVDEVAAIAAMRHSQTPVITASVDSFDFLYPIQVGEAISVEAFVTWTGRTSMEVFVRVTGEDLLTGESRVTATSFLTMIATDENGTPTPVPPVEPQTDEQRLLNESAPERYEQRRLRKRWHRSDELRADRRDGMMR